MKPAAEVYREYLDFASLVSGGRVVPNWLPDSSGFWYIAGEGHNRNVFKCDVQSGHCSPLLDLPRLREALVPHCRDVSSEGLPFVTFARLVNGNVELECHGRKYEVNLTSYTVSKRLPTPQHAYADLVLKEEDRVSVRHFKRWRFFGSGRQEISREAASPDGRWAAGIKDFNLALRATVDGQEVQLTTDGSREAFWDVEADLWSPWSPCGLYLAVFKQHTENMIRVPVVEWLKPWEQLGEAIGIPAGGVLCHSQLYLVDVLARKAIPVDLGDTRDQYVRILGWSTKSGELIVSRHTRTLDQVQLAAVDRKTRAVRTILVERSKTFLAHHHEVIWGKETGFTILSDGRGLIWRSERDGWRQLYHYDMNGQLVRQLTSEHWPVSDVVAIDSERSWVYFMGRGDLERPYDLHLYRVRMDGSTLSQLTRGRGQHRVCFSPSVEFFTDTFSSVDRPPSTLLMKSDGTFVAEVARADISRLREVGWTAPKEYSAKAADGTTDLWATVFFPFDFNPKRKYPVLEYIYGGPQMIARPLEFGDESRFAAMWSTETFNRAIAQLGFIVITIDARGTPGRSKAFQDAIHRNWGAFEIGDHVAVLQQLSERLGCFDMTRVGVWGWSWGGQYAFRALATAPHIYKAGICGWPAFDPYRVTLYEPYLGTPQENPEGYLSANTYDLVPRMSGTVLLVGGMSDPSTQADFFKMSELLMRAGKLHRTMVYPYCGHGAVGAVATYDMELKRSFFLDSLGTERRDQESGQGSGPY